MWIKCPLTSRGALGLHLFRLREKFGSGVGELAVTAEEGAEFSVEALQGFQLLGAVEGFHVRQTILYARPSP